MSAGQRYKETVSILGKCTSLEVKERPFPYAVAAAAFPCPPM
jgi:hypothetical protein